jgi:hypothetical protein
MIGEDDRADICHQRAANESAAIHGRRPADRSRRDAEQDELNRRPAAGQPPSQPGLREPWGELIPAYTRRPTCYLSLARRCTKRLGRPY